LGGAEWLYLKGAGEGSRPWVLRTVLAGNQRDRAARTLTCHRRSWCVDRA